MIESVQGRAVRQFRQISLTTFRAWLGAKLDLGLESAMRILSRIFSRIFSRIERAVSEQIVRNISVILIGENNVGFTL